MTAGPFDTERDVREAIGMHDWPQGSFLGRNELALLEACASTGVQLGEYDRRILAWLAQQPPQTVAVLVGIILRAGEQQ